MKRERGELISFNYCYGYKFSDDKKTFIVGEEQAKIVRRIYQWYLDGYGSSPICKMINRNGNYFTEW